MIVCMCFLSWERGGRCCHWQRYFSHKTLTSWFLPTPMNLWQITFDPKSPPAPSLAGRTKISGCLVQHIEMQARSQKHLTQSSYLSLQMFPSNQCWVLCMSYTLFNVIRDSIERSHWQLTLPDWFWRTSGRIWTTDSAAIDAQYTTSILVYYTSVQRNNTNGNQVEIQLNADRH